MIASARQGSKAEAEGVVLGGKTETLCPQRVGTAPGLEIRRSGFEKMAVLI